MFGLHSELGALGCEEACCRKPYVPDVGQPAGRSVSDLEADMARNRHLLSKGDAIARPGGGASSNLNI